MCVAVANESKTRHATIGFDLGGQPHLADTALHLIGGTVVLLGQGLKPPPKLDDVAIAILPIVEQCEIGEYLVEARGLAGFVQRIHESQYRREKRALRPTCQKSWGRNLGGKGHNRPKCAPLADGAANSIDQSIRDMAFSGAKRCGGLRGGVCPGTRPCPRSPAGAA